CEHRPPRTTRGSARDRRGTPVRCWLRTRTATVTLTSDNCHVVDVGSPAEDAPPMTLSDMLVVDADGHLCEPPRLWEDNLPAGMRERGIRLRWNADTGYDECWVEDGMATDRGLVGLGNAGETFADFGRGRHYEDLNPAGFDPHERVKVLDAEGIDVSVMYPGLGLKLGGIRDPDVAVACCQVYNDWLADWCAQQPDRLIGVGALPLQDPARAADEV